MKKVAIILVSILAVISLGVGGFVFYKVNTPEYALLETFVDLRDSGIDGLEEHMTKEAWTQVENVRNLSENPLVMALSSAFPKQVEEMLSKVKSMDWSVKDILKGKKSAEVIIQFTDHEKIKGTISLTMIKEDHKWKIDKLKWPKFEQFAL